MAILGAHMSIAGGYYKAVERAKERQCDCVQLFTKNNNRWHADSITPADSQRFTDAISKLQIVHPIAHDSYLINMASPDDELWQKSIDAFVKELFRAETLRIPYVVAHPGSHTTSTATNGLKRIIEALDEVHSQADTISAKCLLETTAGQGTNLGWQFEQLASIIDAVNDPERLGVCFDTCHAFAAGYPMGTQKEYKTTMQEFDSIVGLGKIKAFHLNDSKRELGSRVDRHAHIGRGEMGLEPFRHLLNDERFVEVPMYLETPKEQENGVELDIINLKTLRSLLRQG